MQTNNQQPADPIALSGPSNTFNRVLGAAIAVAMGLIALGLVAAHYGLLPGFSASENISQESSRAAATTRSTERIPEPKVEPRNPSSKQFNL